METREPGHIRMNPPFFSSRRYYLNQLRKRIQYVIENFIKDKGYRSLMDYGSGNSPYKPLFQEYISDYQAADLISRSDIPITLNPDGSVPGHDNSFDVVLSTQVLEHVFDPARYLSESRRVLNPEGILILTTHGYWMYHPDPTDFWRWTSAGLKKIINEAGFDLLYFGGIIGRNAMGLQLFQDGFLFKLPKFLRPGWSVIMQCFIFLTDQLNSKAAIDRDACTYILVAKVRKP